MFQPVYLDHNATTPLHPAVLAAMLPWLESRFGNASSRHEYGRAARHAIDEARQQVAAAVNAHPTEVVFTSGGSEANNLFIKGAAASFKPGLLAVSAIEHPCILKPAAQLARNGWQVETVAVDSAGRVDFTAFSGVVAARPRLVSIMSANNETGVVQDVAALATAARSAGSWFHTDAVQALGKQALDFRAL
ncbi:MAG: aminotransferase class V-fold PLP-dependent enzyme, partial [Azonexus sp.]